MQALESLSDSQVNDFLSGKAPLNLTMRLGDHMMLIQLQLSTVTPTTTTTNTATSTAPVIQQPQQQQQQTANNNANSPCLQGPMATSPTTSLPSLNPDLTGAHITASSIEANSR